MTVFLVLGFITMIAADKCTDTENSLCNLMMSRVPEFCSDPCLAKLCRKSCNLCPLSCFSCNDSPQVSNCTTVTTCSDPTDYCFTTQAFTPHFTETYRLGCGSQQTCLQYNTNPQRDKRASIEAGCCNTDRCNNKPPTLLKIIPEKNLTILPPTLDPNVCQNRDDEVCKQLSDAVDNPCIDDCVATKLCPKMCNKCFYCLDCNEVDDPSQCTQTTICGNGRECYGFEKLGSKFTQVVQLGCIDRQLCQRLDPLSPHHIFGKRDLAFKGGCCIGEKCNINPVPSVHETTTVSYITSTTVRTTTKVLQTTATTVPGTFSAAQTTTTSTGNCPHYYHSCPSGFTSTTDHRHCLLFDNTKRTRAESEMFCKEHCAGIFYVSELHDVGVLGMFLQYEDNRVLEVYTDMKKNENEIWISTNNNQTIPMSKASIIQHSVYNNCASAHYSHSATSSTSYRSVIGVHCDRLMKTLCKITLK